MIYGVCGRIGSGKTTFCNMIAPCSHSIKMERMEPMVYIMHTLFNFPLRAPRASNVEPIWNMSYDIALGKMHDIMKFIMPNYMEILPLMDYVPIVNIVPKNNFIEIGLADPLKLIASVIFGIDYTILLGNTEESRRMREIIKSPYRQDLTGRTCLEYLGMVMREAFDINIWVKIAKRNIEKLPDNINVVISDIRFHNELILIDKLIMIYRNENDNILTDADRNQHPSRWMFLTFKYDKKIHNTTLDELRSQASLIIEEDFYSRMC